MTSERQIAANQRNARKSTGPRSPAGKDRAAKNALKHGLTARITSDARRAAQIDKLATKIAGATDARILECARVIAASALELDRVRRIRIGIIKGSRVLGFATAQLQGGSCQDTSPMKDADEGTESTVRNALLNLQRILRYERRAVAKRDKALRRLIQIRLETRPPAQAGLHCRANQ